MLKLGNCLYMQKAQSSETLEDRHYVSFSLREKSLYMLHISKNLLKLLAQDSRMNWIFGLLIEKS